ncbi:MAG: hypothetical protein RR009_01745 [Oscillospiraceae bacterium]
MKYSVDRIENETVVLVDENGCEHCKEQSAFNCVPTEGMIFEQKRGGGLYPCHDQTEQAREDANELLDDILNNSKSKK